MLKSRKRKADRAARDGQDDCGLDLSSTDGGRTRINLISKFVEENGQYLWWKDRNL